MKPLGHRQRSVLRLLRDGRSYPGGGWYYGTDSETVRICESLVRAGLAARHGSATRYEYRATQGPLRECDTHR